MIRAAILAFPVRLRASDREALENHFLSLGPEDRRLRFGSSIGNDALRDYVGRIDFEREGLFAVHDDEMRLLAVAHIALTGDTAELGLSVLPQCRAQGLGGTLFRHAVMHLRNRGVHEVFVHCITENAAMMHLARKHDMRLVNEGSETDARLALDPPTAQSLFTEWFHDHHAGAIHLARQNLLWSRTLLGLAPAR